MVTVSSTHWRAKSIAIISPVYTESPSFIFFPNLIWNSGKMKATPIQLIVFLDAARMHQQQWWRRCTHLILKQLQHISHTWKCVKQWKKKENVSRDVFIVCLYSFCCKAADFLLLLYQVASMPRYNEMSQFRCVLCLQIVVSENRPSVSLCSLCKLWAQACAIFILELTWSIEGTHLIL